MVVMLEPAGKTKFKLQPQEPAGMSEKPTAWYTLLTPPASWLTTKLPPALARLGKDVVGAASERICRISGWTVVQAPRGETGVALAVVEVRRASERKAGRSDDDKKCIIGCAGLRK